MRLLLFLPILAACSPEQPETQETPMEPPPAIEAEVTAVPRDGPPSPPSPPLAPPVFPGLMPLSEVQVVAALGSGARCALGDGGQSLMVAVPGAAVANDRGRIVRLEAGSKDWAALLEGGTFTGDGVRIEVDAGAVVRREGEMTMYDASVQLQRGRHGFLSSHGPRWTCGG